MMTELLWERVDTKYFCYSVDKRISFSWSSDFIYYYCNGLVYASERIDKNVDIFKLANQWAEDFHNVLLHYETNISPYEFICLSCDKRIIYHDIGEHWNEQHSGQSVKSANKGL